MASQKQEVLQLDPVLERMLLALVRLDNKRPGNRFSYPAICDEVRSYTKNEVTPTMSELRQAKRPLLDHGLIRDEGIGFVPTDEGRAFARKDRQPARTH